MNDNPFLEYTRKGKAEMRYYIPGEDMSDVSVSMVDRPVAGGMIARNRKDHSDQWYVDPKYFLKNFEVTVH